jgi:hypothetical protein
MPRRFRHSLIDEATLAKRIRNHAPHGEDRELTDSLMSRIEFLEREAA